MPNFINGVSGFGYIKSNGKYVVVFGDNKEVAIFLPYTTRLQAKKLAKRLAV